MRNIIAIAKKELTVSLTTPWAWIVFTAVSFISSAFFLLLLQAFQAAHAQVRQYQLTWDQAPPDLQTFRNLTDGVIGNLWDTLLIITLFVTPFLSARLFAEEKKQKTFELLMTTPVRSAEIVLGKYLGGLGIVLCTLSVTLIYPLVLTAFGASDSASGSAVEWSTVLLGYLALLLWGATCMAMGMFISALTESQIVAGVVTLILALGWMLLGAFGRGAEEPFKGVLEYLAFGPQLSGLMRGVLDVKPLVFFGSVITAFILLTHRAVEARRWS
jgi:ABC-2 type transport system permease protein